MLNKKFWKRFVAAKLFVAFVVLGALAGEARAAWGDLDPTFGSGGMFQDSVTGHTPKDVAVQTDGKILVTGCRLASNGRERFFLRRYLASGALDTSFGSGGSAVVNAIIKIDADYCGRQVKIVNGNRIAVLGTADDKNAVWMVGLSGYGLTSFGYNGYKSLSNYPLSVFIKGHFGSIGADLYIGFYDFETRSRVVLIKLDSTGAQDMSFGLNGEPSVRMRVPAGYIPAFKILAEEDAGRITVLGLNFNGDAGEIKLERRQSNGFKDFSFAFAPVAVDYPVLHFGELYKLADGRYVFSFIRADGSTFTGGYFRVAADGALQEIINTYGNSSILGVQPDGKIVTQSYYSIVRYDQEFNALENFSQYPNITQLNTHQYAFSADNKLIVVGLKDEKLTLIRLLAE